MPIFKTSSILAYWLCAALLVTASMFYYPKWSKPATEATISWDVSGYYLYLPGALIYKDLKTLKWWEAINEKYRPGHLYLPQSLVEPPGPLGRAFCE